MAREPGALLAIETATRVAGVALLRGGEPLGAQALDASRPVSETLLPGVESLLARAGLAPGELASVAVSLGPGSFTGLRVGLATAKGLALAPVLPLVGVPTLAALAQAAAGGATAPGWLVAVLDAQRGEVYAAAWPAPSGPQEELAWADPALPEGLWQPGALAAALAGLGSGVVHAVGEGLAVAGGSLGEALGSRFRPLPPPGGAERALAVARLGAEALARGAAHDPAALAPRYLRRAEAEARRTGRAVEAGERRPEP